MDGAAFALAGLKAPAERMETMPQSAHPLPSAFLGLAMVALISVPALAQDEAASPFGAAPLSANETGAAGRADTA